MKKAIKSLALALVLGVAAQATCVAPAFANEDQRYDRSIEEAAANRLKEKLGGMRGSLEFDTEDHIYPPIGLRTPDGEKSPWLLLDEMGETRSVVPVWG